MTGDSASKPFKTYRLNRGESLFGGVSIVPSNDESQPAQEVVKMMWRRRGPQLLMDIALTRLCELKLSPVNYSISGWKF